MVANKSKKAKTDGQIDAKIVLSIEKLQKHQKALEKLKENASVKVLEVEKKYSEIRKPIYDKRNEIIKSISDFWPTVFYAHPTLTTLLTEEDYKILKYLSSLDVEDVKVDVENAKDVKYGYSITFHFDSNPYFEEEKLTKTYTFKKDGATEISSPFVIWKEGKGLPNEVNQEMKGNKDAVSQESFFTWFTWSNEDDEFDEEMHVKVGDIIKKELWPNPLNYFKSVKEPDEEDVDGDEEEADEDGDDEGQKGDYEEDDEEEEGGEDGEEEEGEEDDEEEGGEDGEEEEGEEDDEEEGGEDGEEEEGGEDGEEEEGGEDGEEEEGEEDDEEEGGEDGEEEEGEEDDEEEGGEDGDEEEDVKSESKLQRKEGDSEEDDEE